MIPSRTLQIKTLFYLRRIQDLLLLRCMSLNDMNMQESHRRDMSFIETEQRFFDIYAEDQEYSDTDPIYTEDNPKYVPLMLTTEQYRTLFHLDADLSRRLRRLDVSDAPSLYANTIDHRVDPQLWFMKTGYIFLHWRTATHQPRSNPLLSEMLFRFNELGRILP